MKLYVLKERSTHNSEPSFSYTSTLEHFFPTRENIPEILWSLYCIAVYGHVYLYDLGVGGRFIVLTGFLVLLCVIRFVFNNE